MAPPVETAETPMSRSIHRFVVASGLIYWVMLFPTAWLALSGNFQDALISRLMPQTWNAEYWHFPGLSETASRYVVDGLLYAAIIGLTWLFLRTLRLIAEQKQALMLFEVSLILTGCMMLGAVLMPVIPFHSSDLYGYINRGAQQSLFGVNPYTVTVAEIPGWQGSPMLHEHWIHNPCPYGFFFARLAAFLTGLSGNTFFGSFMLFKALNWLAFAGSLWLIFLMSGKLGGRRPWLNVFLFGASPLVLLHAMANGHNDILLIFLLLASLWLVQGGRRAWLALPVLTLSVLTKYASLLALPFIGLYLLKTRRYVAVAVGIMLSALLVWWLGASYVASGEPWPWKDMLDNAGKPQHSLAAALGHLVYYPVKWLTALDADAVEKQALSILKPIFWSAFVGFYAWRCWGFLRKGGVAFNDLLFETGLVMLVMIALVSAKFHSWYVLMFYPLLILLPEASRLRQAGLWLALFQIAGFTFLQSLHIINWLLLTALPLWLGWSGRRLETLGQPEAPSTESENRSLPT